MYEVVNLLTLDEKKKDIFVSTRMKFNKFLNSKTTILSCNNTDEEKLRQIFSG